MKQTVIKCGKLYDGVKDELQEHMEILIEDKYIKEVGKNLAYMEAAEKIDLSGATVTPGMIDAHMHMDYFDWRTIREDVLFASDEWKTMGILHTAQRSLARGFTTVRHIGNIAGAGFGSVDVKRLIEKGIFSGCRIVTAPGMLGTPGSHADLTQGLWGNYPTGSREQARFKWIGSGRAFMANAVREQVKYGADFIKMIATGGFFTPNDSPTQQQLSDDEIKTIIATAHELEKKVTAHVYDPKLIAKLVDFGIDGLEHAAMIDEETAKKVEEAGVYVVPTFCPYDEVVNYDEKALLKKQPEFRKKLELYRERLVNGRDVLKKSRIKLGYGTDFVAVHNNYESGYEYEAWLKSGMDPFRALKAATIYNAGILDIADKTGSIEPGKYADIAAWKRDLLRDPRGLLDCTFVMKEGTVYQTEQCE